MPELRAFGRDTTVRIVAGGLLQTQITAIKDATINTNQKIVKENYLGESATRQDMIFEDVTGSINFDLQGTQALALQHAIAQKAQRRVANDITVTLSMRVRFPDGTTARITVPDCQFDPIPFAAPARDQYLKMTLTFASSSYLLALA